MFCVECSLGFFYNPVKLGLALSSLFISLILFIILKRYQEISVKKRIGLIYAHIFTLVFPFVFYALFKGCQQILYSCDRGEQIAYLLLITTGLSFAIGMVSAPMLFLNKHKRNSVEIKDSHLLRFVKKHSFWLNIRAPGLYLINIAKPLAFSVNYIKASIFLSVGLVDLLTKKEVEAVLLHELSHVKNRSSIYKLSTKLLRLISPLSRVTTFNEELDKEELKADRFAIKTQKTERHIISAKKKIDEFYKYKDN